ncbi:ATP-dependent Lhr-like helicase [Camelimonas lactis]|uniref:ATP-dependent Lhr-like helicase n=1 Tax=Camelimonas lactis TaxID=659006 RepID=A0A4R2GPT2_9HYPH|nr:ATP-dependent Lhr-like helicase [Camelimonas lactis]
MAERQAARRAGARNAKAAQDPNDVEGQYPPGAGQVFVLDGDGPPPVLRPGLLPDAFADWFAARGWRPRPHQLLLLDLALAGRSTLLVAPTGAGKTLAGFLPSLVELAVKPDADGLHTLYISPLKALAVDVARNLETPVAGMALDIRVETRTGDTPPHKRARQMRRPPHILMTTPEQLALMLAHPDSGKLFGSLRRVVLDELHALVTSKRGDLLALDLARVRRLAPGVAVTGLSATVREPQALATYLSGVAPLARPVDIVRMQGGARPEIAILDGQLELPIAGHTTAWAMPDVYQAIRSHRLTLVFVNTRLQAEFAFQELWRLNEDTLPIALHHGSLDATRRRRVEAAMVDGRLRAVVCTATLDLGVDWGDVDLVINLGAPKGASRLMQRIGRANHRLDEPSRAWLVPSNRFEALECEAALELVEEAAQDTPDPRAGALDVLAQHVLGMAVAGPFTEDGLFAEVSSAAPYAGLSRADFDDVLAFAATGGYALRSYEQFARIRRDSHGQWRIATAAAAQRYRLNVGTIVEAAKIKVRLSRPMRARRPDGKPGLTPRPAMGGRFLGEVEEDFAEQLVAGDTFVFAGEILRFEGLVANEALVTRATGRDPKIPAWAGGKFPLSTFLAARVRQLLADPDSWEALPPEVRTWLTWQQQHSRLPQPDELLAETFPHAGRHYLAVWPFEGRLAHQTLGMLLTRRLERARLRPLGFVANDYGVAVWAAGDLAAAFATGSSGAPRLALDDLFSEDMLGDDLEEWLDESALMKRTFRHCAIIAGLIERRHPGMAAKTGRQVTISTDLIYDVLRRHEPDHVLLRAARRDAASGLLDLKRLADMLARIRGRVVWQPLERISPLSIALVLEIGRESTPGDADALLAEAEGALVDEALA